VYINFVKPILDFITALIAFIVLSPIFLIVVMLLGIHLKGSPFFLQKRPGKNERIFTILKFKTMNEAKDALGNLLPDSERLTALGKFIRSTSLDEIPQLLNVIKGEMSIIGPRPLLPEYLKLYNSFQKKRHEVKPGITGWAQVNGRNAISWEEKFELDVYYVQNVTFVLDVKILFKTLKKVFIREGINNQTSVTTDAFKGNNNQ
jgi:lipopolysaccharide/colanic/teichoic acid biosynthesis glycosyltransferase